MKRGVLSGVLLLMLVGASGWAKEGRTVPNSRGKGGSTKVVGAKKPPKKNPKLSRKKVRLPWGTRVMLRTLIRSRANRFPRMVKQK